MADDFDRFAFNREATDWEEFNSLGALDDAPPPNPRFVRALRGELMNQAETLAQPSPQPGRRHAPRVAAQSSLAAPPIQRKRWDRTLMLEAIAVAVLMIALIGSITMRGGNGGGNETANGAINPPVLESDHTSWMYRQDAARTNVSKDSGPVTAPKLDWRATINDGVIAIADGVIVTLGTNSTTMQGWSVETGESIWTTTLDFMNPGQAAAGDGYVFLSPLSQDGSVAAYDLKTGSQVWTSTSINGFGSQPAVYDGKLYYLAFDRTLQVVDALSGKSLWSVDVSAEPSLSTPNADADSIYTNVLNNFAVAVGDGVVLVTGGDANITAYDLTTHERKWSLKTEGDKVTTPVIADGTVYFTSTRYNPTRDSKDDPHAAGWTYSINAATGDVTWIRSSDPFSSVGGLIGTDALLLGTSIIISRADGKDLGQLPGDEATGYYGSWTFGKNAIYSVDGDGNLIAWSYDPASHALSERWSAYLAAQPYEGSNGLGIVGDQLIVRGPNSTLIALSADSAAPDSAAASGTPSALDFSGLTACSPPPAVD
ncbi:MAG: PQQ-binding-like beta-propeller repeat protein, partial [Thermomicrobiales bacterium]